MNILLILQVLQPVTEVMQHMMVTEKATLSLQNRQKRKVSNKTTKIWFVMNLDLNSFGPGGTI